MTRAPRQYILTGTPGAGKTTVLRALGRDTGYALVDEAATDVIADLHALGVEEPWRSTDFTERIAALQQERETAPYDGEVRVFDRSPVCTLALARYLGHPVGPVLGAELERVARSPVYQRRVFLVRPLGFITPTRARRISYEESLIFEEIHENTYGELGFELIDVPPGDVADRAAGIASMIRGWS